MVTVSSVISAILAVLKAIPIVDGWFQQLLVAYIDSQDQQTKGKIADAAAFGARAKTEEERYETSRKWQAALSRPRITL